MGQSFHKLTSGGEEGNTKEEVIKQCYETHFKDKEGCSQSEFFRAICDTVEKLNEKHGYTQVRAIPEKTLREEYQKYHKEGNGKPTDKEFKEIMDALEKKLEFTGVGVKDTLLYIFGVPASATFIKNAVMPSLVSNEVLIPSMTSLTVLVLAKLNKI